MYKKSTIFSPYQFRFASKMRIIKFLITLSITLGLIYIFNNQLVINNQPIPPLGKFLDPFQGFWQNATSDPLPYQNEITIEGLGTPVNIQYDSSYVPHIFAENKEDLFFAQGYVIAQHRLWQMDFQTYAASGRISELIGKQALQFDKLQRRKGMVYGAEKALEAMTNDPELYAYILKYTEGVNSYIDNLKYKDLPFEYKLLDYTPEPWTPLKSALLLQYMIDNLTGWDQDIEKTNAYNLFGQDVFNQLYPNYSTHIDPIAPTPEEGWQFDSVKTNTGPDSLFFNDSFISATTEMPDPDNGSNNWVVAGWKTKSGNPILSSDMHLGLNLPSLWFLIELSAPDFNVMGFALAGNVGVVAGFNKYNAWAFTDVSRDERDWYKITFTDDNKEEYLFEGTNIKTSKVIEEIKIRGEETQYDTVIYTHHGPIVYDESFPSNEGSNGYALKWIGHYPSRVQKALIELNRSKNYTDYLNALESWDAPSQHVAFASVSGDIAIRVQGLWPNKWKNQGLFIMDGSQKSMEWPDFIPTDHYAYLHNPERGFVSSANQHSVDQNYPYWQGWASPDSYRGRRINKILNSYDSASITANDMMKLQQDDYGILPSEILPILLDSMRNVRADITNDSIFRSLNNWDYHYSADYFAPAAFISWWRNIKKLLWDEMRNEEIALNSPTDYQTIHLFKNGIPSSLIDNKTTANNETLSDIISMSYDSMRGDLQKWIENNGNSLNWGNYKSTSIIHLARIPALSTMNIHVNGEDDAVNSTKRNHGPSQRIVVEMSNPPQAWAIIPGGQSGNPGNPAYDNMIEAWKDGTYLKMNFLQQPVETTSILLNQTLAPQKQ